MKKIRFKKDVELELVTSFDADHDMPITELETFKAGEVHEVELIGPTHDHYDVQFGNGHLAMHVFQPEVFDILSD